MGIFQFTEKGAQNLAKRVQPKSIIDISAITSIYRPGPLSAGVDKAYVDAVRDPLSINYENEIVEEITRETRGFLIFQEQIALLAHRLGKGITLDDANLLRKLLTKKGLDASKQAKKEEILHKFVEGCIEKGMNKRTAEDMWQKFEYFSGYGFNKSHAVAYSIVSYQCAWLATYYNAEWACAFLDKEPESRKEAAINIAKSWGYKIIPLNINTSGRRWTAQNETTLVAPLTTIKGLGDAAIDEIIERANAVEDAIAAGDSLESAADAAGVSLMRFDGVTRTGLDTAGNRIDGLPPEGQFLAVAFQTEENENSILTERPHGGYFVVRVDRVVPETKKPFEQVQAQVLNDWRESQRSEQAEQAAAALAETLRSGADPSGAAADASFSLTTLAPFTRTQSPDPATPGLVTAVFDAGKGDTLVHNDYGRVFVVSITDVTTGQSGESSENERLRQSIDRDRRVETAQAFQRAIRARYEVEIDQQAVDYVLR